MDSLSARGDRWYSSGLRAGHGRRLPSVYGCALGAGGQRAVYVGPAIPREELERMREAVAQEYGFKLYRQYGEEQAAAYLEVDPSTMKRWRREGRTPYINLGTRKIRYLGIHIADMIIGVRGGEIQQ